MKIELPSYLDILSMSEFPGFGGMSLVDLVQGSGVFGLLIIFLGMAAVIAAIVGKVNLVLVFSGAAALVGGVVGSGFVYSRMIDILSSAPSSPDPQALTNGANSVAFTLSFGIAVAILGVVMLLPRALIGLALSDRGQDPA